MPIWHHVSYDGRMSPQSSLTSRRKAATRMEIARAASTLLARHGTAAVTAEAIAEAAGVSLRTFYRYFRTKEESVTPILTFGAGTWQRTVAQFAPDGGPAGIARAITEVLSPDNENDAASLREARELVRAVPNDPALQAVWLIANDDSEKRLYAIIADARAAAPEYADDDRGVHMASRLLAAAATTAIRLGIEQWAAAGDDVDYDDPASGPKAIALHAFSQLSSGIDVPTAEP